MMSARCNGIYSTSAIIVCYTGGTNHLLWWIIYHIHGHDLWKIVFLILWSEEIIVVGYNLVSFLYNCMENFSVWTIYHVLFIKWTFMLIWFFFLIDIEFNFKITLRISNPEIHFNFCIYNTKVCPKL